MTNETKQTAVEQLFIEMLEIQQSGKTLTFDENVELLNKYKEMEKERIETAYNKGTVHGIDYPESTLPLTGEQYYEQTYGGNK